MRVTRSSVLGIQESDGRLARFIRRNLIVGIGVVLIVIAAAFAASLATWSIKDPSLSHATNSPVRNVMGIPGAIFADLTIQIIGIASVFFVLPILIWGWRLVTDQGTKVSIRHIAAWLIGTVLVAASVSTLPTPETWPLPTALGGLVGGAVAKLVTELANNLPPDLQNLGALVGSGLPALTLLAYAIGLINIQTRRPKLDFDQSTVKDYQSESLLDDFEDEKDEDLSTITGAFYHWIYMIRSFLFRMLVPSFLHKYLKKSKDNSFKKTLFGSLFRRVNPFSHNDGLDDLYLDTPANQDGKFTTASNNREVEGNGNNIADGKYTEGQAPLLGGLDRNSRLIPAGYSTATEGGLKTGNIEHGTKKSRIIPQAKAPKPSDRFLSEAQQSFFPRAEEFELPQLNLLIQPEPKSKGNLLSPDVLDQNARILESVLEDFGIRGEISKVRPGPVVTLYELEPAPGIKTSRVISLADDIARSMSAISARVAVIPGKNAIGIELPNQERETVYLRELIGSTDFDKSKAKLAMALGKKINGESMIVDLARMPHLLVAGTTGSGKSVSVNTMILSLLYRLSPDDCKLIMIDPKMLELSIYEGIPHLLTPVVTDPSKAVVALKWTVREMEERYKMMSKVGVRNIDGFNARVSQALEQGQPITRTVQTGFDHDSGEAIYEEEQLELSPFPYIVVIVDEMADLMMVAGKDIEGAIQRLAQMARAAGIHLIMATQRPSVDVITGTIKANFPTRISFQVTSKIDSRTILGEQGAEQLLGMGDMLYMAGGGRIQRVHAPFVSDNEVEEIVEHLKSQGCPQYLEQVTEETEDAVQPGQSGDSLENSLYDQAVAIVLRDQKASTSYIQRRLSIGYNRAATLIEQMESNGIISQANHAGKREILVPSEEGSF